METRLPNSARRALTVSIGGMCPSREVCDRSVTPAVLTDKADGPSNDWRPGNLTRFC